MCVYILYCSWLKLIDIDKFLIFLAGWLESLSRLTSNINCNGKEKEKMENKIYVLYVKSLNVLKTF